MTAKTTALDGVKRRIHLLVRRLFGEGTVGIDYRAVYLVDVAKSETKKVFDAGANVRSLDSLRALETMLRDAAKQRGVDVSDIPIARGE